MRIFAWKNKNLNYLEISFVAILFLLSLVLRLYSTARYNFTEDEIFALEFNQVHSLPQLLTAPDFDHPPLWYMAMDPIVSAGATTFELRLIQIVIFSLAIGVSFWLLSPFPLRYRLVPLGWLAINPYIIHITAGYLMHSSVLSFAVISFCWVLRILRDWSVSGRIPSTRQVLALTLVMSLGLLSDYSFFWFSCFLALFFILSWLYKREKIWITLLGSVILSGLLDIWFLPVFWKNLFLTAEAHQWAPQLSLQSFLRLLADLLGFVVYPTVQQAFEYFIVFLIVLLVFSIIHTVASAKKYLFDFVLNQWVSLVAVTGIFVLICSLFPGSFFYAKVCLTLIVPLTFLITFTCLHQIKKNHFSALSLILITVLTLLSLFLYFQPTDVYIWDFQQQPMSRLLESNFPPQSCAFLTPWWIYSEASFNLPQKSNIRLINSHLNSSTYGCEKFYILEQSAFFNDGHHDPAEGIDTQYGVCLKTNSLKIVENEQLLECQ